MDFPRPAGSRRATLPCKNWFIRKPHADPFPMVMDKLFQFGDLPLSLLPEQHEASAMKPLVLKLLVKNRSALPFTGSWKPPGASFSLGCKSWLHALTGSRPYELPYLEYSLISTTVFHADCQGLRAHIRQGVHLFRHFQRSHWCPPFFESWPHVRNRYW